MKYDKSLLQNAELPLMLQDITGDFIPLNSCLFRVKTKAAKNNLYQCFFSSVNQQQLLQLLKWNALHLSCTFLLLSLIKKQQLPFSTKQASWREKNQGQNTTAQLAHMPGFAS